MLCTHHVIISEYCYGFFKVHILLWVMTGLFQNGCHENAIVGIFRGYIVSIATFYVDLWHNMYMLWLYQCFSPLGR